MANKAKLNLVRLDDFIGKLGMEGMIWYCMVCEVGIEVGDALLHSESKDHEAAVIMSKL